MDTSLVLLTLVAYKATLLGIGLWARRRTASETDFLLGGRGLGPWVAGLSYAASTSSAWVLLGFSGFVYAQGLVGLWMVPGILSAYVVVWLWFGPKLRAESAAENHLTLSDFLKQGTSPGAARALGIGASLMTLFCFVFYIASQFQAAGDAFAVTFAVPPRESVLIGAGVILVYAVLGGFWAVSVTDALQAGMMAMVAVALPIAAVSAAGGPGAVMTTLQSAAPAGFLNPFGDFDGVSWFGAALPAGVAFGGFLLGMAGIGLGAFGQPHLLARLMAVRDDRARRAGFVVAIGWGVMVYAGMSVLAFAGRAALPSLADGETVFYQLASDVLPPVLAGVVIAAVLSAVMSTVDSILLSAAGAASHDLGVSRRWPRHEVLVARLVMAGVCVGAVVLTLTLPASIFGRVLFAWSALGAAFGPIVVARVAGVSPHGWARVAAMVTGFGLTVAFNQFLPSGPGAVGERFLPWLPALAIVFLWRKGNAPHTPA